MMASSSIPPPSFACSQAPKGLDCCCCERCGIGGCDLKVLNCGCCMHARCCPISENRLLQMCPVCLAPAQVLLLMPMAFDEIDQAQQEAAQTNLTNKRGKKRQNATVSRLNPELKGKTSPDSTDLRTGRWTNEETAYCDKLIQLFEAGKLPMPDGVKLNDFLSSMLKSKQSRLTKKMKNARLSARQYKRIIGYIADDAEALEFSKLETEFFASIKCRMERSEIRFHMQKEWREAFSRFCLVIGQKLDADDWLSSVEEMDRRHSQAKDAERLARRKLMVGVALSHDAQHPQNGVFIDPNKAVDRSTQPMPPSNYSSENDDGNNGFHNKKHNKRQRKSARYYSSPFAGRVIQYVERHNVPFEHMDIWVPSFVPNSGGTTASAAPSDQNCRLCYAGCATAETQVPAGGGTTIPLSSQAAFDLTSFGEYSQKFSFDVGCGLPGRVYGSGVPSWEQGIQNAPSGLFERQGGASQWGIQTVLGIPIPSPTVGRIVVVFYSRHDRHRDPELVTRISGELAKLLPAPRWKLVVDVGPSSAPPSSTVGPTEEEKQKQELLSLIQSHMPDHKVSPLAPYLPGFTSLQLVLTKQPAGQQDSELIKLAVKIYASHKSAGRSELEIAWLTARDFMQTSKQPAAQLSVSSFNQQNNMKALAMSAAKELANVDSNNGCGCNPGDVCGPNSSSNMKKTNNSSTDQRALSAGYSSLPQRESPGALASPALQPIPSPNEAIGNFGLSASQIAAILQHDAAASSNFEGI